MRTGEYSLGMRQRLAVATALLGEPPVLILDEPANGLDPAGVAWLRGLLRTHAEAGGTVLLSSHLLGEVELLVDDVVIIAGGEVRLAAPLAELAGSPRLRVRGGDLRTLYDAFSRYGAYVDTDGSALFVEGLTPEQAGDIALAVQVPIYELAVETVSLEEVFFELAGAK
jgi:ABC-2 type transport system ATP-binding protein